MEYFENNGHTIVLYPCQKGQEQKRRLKDCLRR